MDSEIITADVSSLPAGIYVAKIQDTETNHVVYNKFVKN